MLRRYCTTPSWCLPRSVFHQRKPHRACAAPRSPARKTKREVWYRSPVLSVNGTDRASWRPRPFFYLLACRDAPVRRREALHPSVVRPQGEVSPQAVCRQPQALIFPLQGRLSNVRQAVCHRRRVRIGLIREHPSVARCAFQRPVMAGLAAASRFCVPSSCLPLSAVCRQRPERTDPTRERPSSDVRWADRLAASGRLARARSAL